FVMKHPALTFFSVFLSAFPVLHTFIYRKKTRSKSFGSIRMRRKYIELCRLSLNYGKRGIQISPTSRELWFFSHYDFIGKNNKEFFDLKHMVDSRLILGNIANYF